MVQVIPFPSHEGFKEYMFSNEYYENRTKHTYNHPRHSLPPEKNTIMRLFGMRLQLADNKRSKFPH